MSAQLAGAAAGAPSNSFSAKLVLAAGVTAYIDAPTLTDLFAVVARLQRTEAGNETGKPAPAPTPAATAPAGGSASPTAASSAPAAAAPAAQGDAGNGAAASPSPAPAAASSASSSAPAESPAVTFDELKKAFLALSAKAGGRALCESVLGTVEPKLAKLSDAKPEQYAGLLAAIKKAAG